MKKAYFIFLNTVQDIKVGGKGRKKMSLQLFLEIYIMFYSSGGRGCAERRL
jgi:hypothetical protein